jgi:hypothetical protein
MPSGFFSVLLTSALPIHKLRLICVLGESIVSARLFIKVKAHPSEVKRLKPLVSYIEHMRRELAWGMTIPKSSPSSESQKHVMSSLQNQSLVLGETILHTLSITQKVIKASFKPGLRRESLAKEKATLLVAETELDSVRKNARNQLKEACTEMELEVREELSQATVPQSVLDACLCTISLLQVGYLAHPCFFIS